MNPGFEQLQPYPFEKLARLRQSVVPAADFDAISLTIGEPKHPTPDFIREALSTHLDTLGRYPTTRGSDELREAIAAWLSRRFSLPSEAVRPDTHVLPVNGTREALFAFAQVVVDRKPNAKVLMPNPFYQIYEGAALLAGAQPVYLNAIAADHDAIDFSAVATSTWRDCELLYICSPANPAGTVLGPDQLEHLLDMAEQHDFVIAADECYSEIYPDENAAPTGLLSVAQDRDFRRCLVFHSLSKRSNAPGLRSGFVAGDPELIRQFLRFRTYHGCSMPLYIQQASIAAWNDEAHVKTNRDLYREKFTAVAEILKDDLPVKQSDGGFYLWPELPINDEQFAAGLLARKNVAVLPGSYLGRTANGINPGAQRARMALVASTEQCTEAAIRIRDYLRTL